MICLADARFAASIINSISIKFCGPGCVEPMMKIRVPLIDSSYDGWNSPSLYVEVITLPNGTPKYSAILFAKVLLWLQAKIFASVAELGMMY